MNLNSRHLQIASTKYTADVRPLLELGKAVAGKAPKTVITDGARNLHEAYTQEFWAQRKDRRTEDIRHIRLAGDRNNNRMERFNGEVRQREKVMRTLERMDSPVLSAYRIYHNLIRPHEALKGRTPSEMAGIAITGKDKWLTIIQNATKIKNQTSHN